MCSGGGLVVGSGRVDDLYGEEPPAAARKSLQSFVANLRREINREDEILVGRRPGYVIEAGSDHIDVLRFDDLLRRIGFPEG